jgi:hypothetical protein
VYELECKVKRSGCTWDKNEPHPLDFSVVSVNVGIRCS